MAASPEFYKPSSTTAFSPCGSPLRSVRRPQEEEDDDDHHYSSCRTPTGSGVSYLREPTTCPPPPCKKRLFHQQQGDVPLLSLRLDELQRIFRPVHPAAAQGLGLGDKRRRSARHQRKLQSGPLEPLPASPPPAA